LQGEVERVAATLDQEISNMDTALADLQGSIKSSETAAKMHADLGIGDLRTAIQESLDRKAALDDNGIILASQLPSYVDDVIDA
jgi:Zn-dependent M28 family amino/carboxypeptidase